VLRYSAEYKLQSASLAAFIRRNAADSLSIDLGIKARRRMCPLYWDDLDWFRKINMGACEGMPAAGV
jgi:hypothetical protein